MAETLCSSLRLRRSLRWSTAHELIYNVPIRYYRSTRIALVQIFGAEI